MNAERLYQFRDGTLLLVSLAGLAFSLFWLPAVTNDGYEFSHDPACTAPLAESKNAASPCTWSDGRVIDSEQLRTLWITIRMSDGRRLVGQGPAAPNSFIDYARDPQPVRVLFFHGRYAGFHAAGGTFLCENSPPAAFRELASFVCAALLACALFGALFVRSFRRPQRSRELSTRGRKTPA